MPIINLFIFPILGGYYILIRCELLRYKQQRLEPQKLIFNSFLIGVFVLMTAWVVAEMLGFCTPELLRTVKSHFPIKQEYFGTCVGSLILAILFTEASNLVISKDRMVSIAIAQMGNEFERLCESCYRNLDLIQVTLKNDKCYVGVLKGLPVPSHSSHIRMLPMYSGYRDKATKDLSSPHNT